ncbi:MAG: type II secretion system F family protein [Verrucomicrobiales bacterium]|nr:type II secretion system F family protein [Verrucomicrobiales bacterium]
MPTFRYKAVDGRGRTHRGKCNAPSEDALSASLRNQGLWLAESESHHPAKSGPPPVISSRAIPRRILVQFFLSLGLQLKAGVPVHTALAFGQADHTHHAFRSIHADLVERVRAGISLSEAFSVHSRAFTPLVINLIRAGESSGNLAGACDEVRAHLEWSDRIAADVRQALVYPVVVLCAVGVFFFIVFSFFIPRFSGVLRELGVPLPAITRAMIAISEFLRLHHVAVFATVVAVVLGAALAHRLSPRVRHLADAAKMRIPLFGPILCQICLSRFLQNLSSLYRSGIPLLDALRLCQSLVGNRILEQGVAQIEEGVRAGRSLHATMSDLPIFPPMVLQMTSLGETTGTLDQSLQSVADYYNVMIPRSVKRLFTLLEPTLILFLLVLVGIVALSVFLPIASALEAR